MQKWLGIYVRPLCSRSCSDNESDRLGSSEFELAR
jgi:hypothetical protein